MFVFPLFLREWALILEDFDGNKPLLTVGFFLASTPPSTTPLAEDLHTDRPRPAAVEGPFPVSSTGHGDAGKR